MKARLSIVLCLLAALSWGQGRVITYYAAAANSNTTTPPPPVDTSYSPEFQAVYDYAVAQNFDIPGWQQRRTLDTLARNAVANGWWAKYDIIYVYANNAGLEWAFINWKNPGSFYADDSVMTFVRDTGISAAGSGNAHANTMFTPSIHGVNYQLSSASASIYIMDDRSTGNDVDFGNVDNINGRLFFRARISGNTYQGQINANLTTISGGENTSTSGFYTINRNGSDITIYKNGSSSYTVSGAPNQLPTGPIYVGAGKNGVNVLNSTSSTYSFFGLGGSLTAGEASVMSEDVKHAVQRLAVVGGSPVLAPDPPVYASSRLMSDTNVQSTSYSWLGEVPVNTDDAYFYQSVEKGLSREDFVINDTTYQGFSDTAKEKGFQLSIPAGRDSWVFPLDLHYFFKHKVKAKELWVYRHGTLHDTGYIKKWYMFYGLRDSSDYGNRVQLTDSIFMTSADGWLKVPSMDTNSEFEAIILSLNKLDRNGLYGNINMNARINWQLLMPDSTLGERINNYATEWTNPLPVDSIMGGNGFRTDIETNFHPDGFSVPDSMFHPTKGVWSNWRMFDDYDNYMRVPGGPFCFNPSMYYAGGMFDTDTVDEKGLEMYSIGQAEAYMTDFTIRNAVEAGAKNIILCIQSNLGSMHMLDYVPSTDGACPSGYYNWNASTKLSDKMFLIGDDYVTDYNSVTRSLGIIDFQFPEHYNYTKTWYEAFKNPDYHRAKWEGERTATGRPTWLDGGAVTGDTAIGNRSSRRWPKITIEANQKIINPDERDSTFRHGDSWRTWGEYCYLAGIQWGNTYDDTTDFQPFLAEGQQISYNNGFPVIVAGGNEDDNSWSNANGRIPPDAGGMQDAVAWNGNNATVQDRFGGYRVGIRAADTTDNGIRISIPASYIADGNYMKERIMWMQYFLDESYAEQQIAQGVEKPRHPHTGAYLRRKPTRVVVEVHDYNGMYDQTGVIRLPFVNVEENEKAIPPEDFDHETKSLEFVQWVRAKYPTWEIWLTEFGIGADDGGRFSWDHDSIGTVFTGDSIYTISGGDTTFKARMYVPTPGYETRVVQQIGMWRNYLSPSFTMIFDRGTEYEIRDYQPPKSYGSNLWYYNHSEDQWHKMTPNTDTIWASQRGGSAYTKFSFMGLLNTAYTPHSGTPVRMNATDIMRGYVFEKYVQGGIQNGVKVKSKVWQSRYRLQSDTSQVMDVVWLKSMGMDTINSTINLLPSATNVYYQKANNGSKYTPFQEDLPDSPAQDLGVTIFPVAIKYELTE